MTDDELIERVDELPRRIQSVKDLIVRAARPAIAVLKDSDHQDHSAKELGALFLELDALERELIQFTRENADALLRLIHDVASGKRR